MHSKKKILIQTFSNPYYIIGLFSLILILAKYFIATRIQYISIIPDEIVYGNFVYNFPNSNFIVEQFLYPLLIVPVHHFLPYLSILEAARIVNLLLSFFFVFILYGLGRLVLVEKKALLFAIVFTFYPPFFFYSFFIMQENLLYPLFFLFLIFLYKSLTYVKDSKYIYLLTPLILLLYLTKIIFILVPFCIILYGLLKKNRNLLLSGAISTILVICVDYIYKLYFHSVYGNIIATYSSLTSNIFSPTNIRYLFNLLLSQGSLVIITIIVFVVNHNIGKSQPLSHFILLNFLFTISFIIIGLTAVLNTHILIHSRYFEYILPVLILPLFYSKAGVRKKKRLTLLLFIFLIVFYLAKEQIYLKSSDNFSLFFFTFFSLYPQSIILYLMLIATIYFKSFFRYLFALGMSIFLIGNLMLYKYYVNYSISIGNVLKNNHYFYVNDCSKEKLTQIASGSLVSFPRSILSIINLSKTISCYNSRSNKKGMFISFTEKEIIPSQYSVYSKIGSLILWSPQTVLKNFKENE